MHAVISCYNSDPAMLIPYFSSVTLYDQSTDTNYANLISTKYKDVVQTQNSGHNISDYIKFILENYENLPDYTFFIKSNTIDRHIDKSTFEKVIKKSYEEEMMGGYAGLFKDSNFRDKKRIAYFLMPGIFLERNNSWYIKNSNPRYFRSYDSFLRFLYENPIIPEYIPFTPGACFGVSKGQIAQIPKPVWATLLKISTYRYFPPEAYLVERVIFTLFTAPYKFNSHFESVERAFDEAESRARELSQYLETRVFLEKAVPKSGILYKVYFKMLSKLRFEITKRY